MGLLSKLGLTTVKEKNATIDKLEKAYDEDMAPRVRLDEHHMIGTEEKIPFQPIHRKEVRDLVTFSDILRTVNRAIEGSMFKKGYETIEKIKEPDEKQKQLIEKIFKDCNDNDQTMIKCLRLFENDLQTYDDGFLLCAKDYKWNGNIIAEAHVKEFVRIEPLFIKIIADDSGRPAFNNNGEKLTFCPVHRAMLLKDKDWCDCGKMTFPAYFKGENHNGTFNYYTKSEVLHVSKYFPSLTYGFPPPVVVWHKVRSLMYQDKYIHDYYAKQRQPKKMAFFNTPDSKGLKKMIGETLAMFKKNPHSTPIIGVNAQGKNKFVETVDFMNNLDEMQFSEVRDEMRRSIAALYKVMPMYTGDVKSSGGLNNESKQIVVTNEAVEDGQIIYNNEVFPWILEQLNITDYEVILNPNSTENELDKLKTQYQLITNAKLMQEMGFDITFKDDNTFKASPVDKPVEPRESSYFPQNTNMSAPEDVFKSDDERNLALTALIKRMFDESTTGLDTKPKLEDAQMNDFIKTLYKSLFDKKYEGVTKDNSGKINDILLKGLLDEDKIDTIKNKMMSLGAKDSQADMIFRTESSSLQNTMRDWSFNKIDPEGKHKYKWIGPTDNRTTKHCKKIMSRTNDGVSLDEMKKIIKQEADPKIYTEDRPFIPHLQCRHRISRKV